MKRQMVYIVGLFFVFSFAYGSHRKMFLKENIYDEYPIDTMQGPYMELPLPEVPSTLREPQKRAAFLLQHFWDKMDFADTLRSHNRNFIEQNFVNFLSIFPHADITELPPAVSRLLNLAEKDKEAYILLADVARKYLYELESPLFNEDYYLLFLNEIVRSSILDKYEKARPAYWLSVVRKNRPGTKAADFGYIDRQKRKHTLYNMKTRKILIVFYDPGCEHCMEVIDILSTNETIRNCIEDGRLSVMAVYADGDSSLWYVKQNMPVGWLDVLDITGVQEREHYVLRTLPTLYLLDENKKVLLKDTSVETLETYLVTIEN